MPPAIVWAIALLFSLASLHCIVLLWFCSLMVPLLWSSYSVRMLSLEAAPIRSLALTHSLTFINFTIQAADSWLGSLHSEIDDVGRRRLLPPVTDESIDQQLLLGSQVVCPRA